MVRHTCRAIATLSSAASSAAAPDGRQDVGVPTPPPLDIITPHDYTPDEIESRAELDRHLSTGTIAGLIIQGVRLDRDPPPALATADVRDSVFVGCRFASTQAAADLVARGALVVPAFGDRPFPTHPNQLYTPDDLAAGFAEHGFAGMYDTVVYDHFRSAGGAVPSAREALVQRLHDNGIDTALGVATRSWTAKRGPAASVGIMGGHAVPRGSATYRLAATLGWELARADRLVVTGGGPGVMEAANLGAYLAGHEPAAVTAAIDLLAAAPDFNDHDRYTAAALEVRRRYP